MTALNDTTARAYNDLVTLNETAVKGYQEAAEGATSPQLKAQLSQFSQQRAQFAAELSQHASRLGISTAAESTLEGAATEAVAAVHRGWINLKSAITGQSDDAILNECENGDGVALKAYETALQATDLPADAKAVIQKQHGEILNTKNQITQMKGRAS